MYTYNNFLTGQQYQSYTPKHIDTPEEILQKHYANVLQTHHDICERGKEVECADPPRETINATEKVPDRPEPLMVSPPYMPKNACGVKSVRFAEGSDRCARDKYDLCNLKTEKDHCDCTKYDKC